MESYLAIANSPLLWVFLTMVAAAFGIMWITSLEVKQVDLNTGWLRRNYVMLLMGAATLLAVSALYFYLFGIGVSLSGIVARLRMAASDETSKPDALRHLGTTVALLMGVLAAAATIFFSIIRVWINERTATATEEGLITDRISNAVEGLGAEKEVNWIGRTCKIWTGEPTTHNRSYLIESEINLPERSQVVKRSSGNDYFYNSEKDDYVETPCGFVEFQTWPTEETRIQRHDQSTKVEVHEWVEDYGDWQVFRSTEPNLEVRVGAIYALERIANDSLRDHTQIVEILCAYVRNNFSALSLKPNENLTERPKPRTDIQTIITVLGRRSAVGKEKEKRERFRLNLRSSDLSGCDFRGLDFSGAQFHDCKVEAALMGNTLLHGAQFWRTLLNHTDFHNAELIGASLQQAIINRPEPTSFGMSDSITFSKNKGLNVAGADISAIDYLGEPEDSNTIFGSKNTILSEELDERRKSAADLQKKLRIANRRNDPIANDLDKKLTLSGFRNWFPHNENDVTYNHEYRKFMEHIGLTGFPYD